MADYSDFVARAPTIYRGTASVTFNLPLEFKERVDRLADKLNRSSSEVYRELIMANVPDLEAATSDFLESRA